MSKHVVVVFMQVDTFCGDCCVAQDHIMNIALVEGGGGWLIAVANDGSTMVQHKVYRRERGGDIVFSINILIVNVNC